MPFREPEQVVVDEHLPVAVGAGADADGRNRELRRDPGGDRRGDGLEHERAAAGVLQRMGVDTSRRAASAVRPCVLKPPSIVADCGVRPTWPMTGIPLSTIARAREVIVPAPSSLMMSAPPSFTKRIAFRTASSSETW